MGSSSPDQVVFYPLSETRAAEERLYSLIQQKDTALAEYRHRIELSKATDGYFDPYHLEAEEWLDVAHSKWRQVQALQQQYEQVGIELTPQKPLTRLEKHQQQLQTSMQHPSGSTCSIPVIASRTHRSSPAHRPPVAAPSPIATPESQTNACSYHSIHQTIAQFSATILQVQAEGGAQGMPCVSSSTTTDSSSSSVSSGPSSSIQEPQQLSVIPSRTLVAASSSVSPHPLSLLSRKPVPSRIAVSFANGAGARSVGSSSGGGALLFNTRSPLCQGPGTLLHAGMASNSNAAAPPPNACNSLQAPRTVFPRSRNHAAAALTSEEECLMLQDSRTVPSSSADNQIAARHALLQHLAMQQQLLEAEWRRMHNTSVPEALRELLLQPVLQVPWQLEQHMQHAPADLREMLLKPGTALENELQRQKLLHDLEAFRDNNSRMGATQTERAKKLYSMLMYTPPEEGQGGMWAALCNLASSYRKQRRLTAEQYRLADDLDVMFMHKKEGPKHYSDLRRLREWLCNQIPWRSMWCTMVLVWSTIFDTWLLLSAKHYSWCQRRRMAWTGYPSIIGQTRGNGALRQYYQNLDQRFVDDEPGHLGLTGLVKAGILPYLEDSTWTPIAIACRLQSAAAADYRWQYNLWQLEHPGVAFVYIDTPVSRPGSVWATESWDLKLSAEEEDLQLTKLVAEHGSTFSKRHLRTALAIFKGVDLAQFEYPTPTLLQLAQTHAKSNGRAAVTISKALLDAEEEQYVSEIEHKQKEIRAFEAAEWKIWIQAIFASAPLLGRLLPHTSAQLLERFTAIQQTKYRLEAQKEQLLDILEGLMERKNVKEPARLLTHHLATHFTGGADPHVWLACQRCRMSSTVGKVASVFGFLATVNEFPVVDDTLAAAAIRHSNRTAQLEKDMPYILGPTRTADDLDEPQSESNGDGWWVALEELKQCMKFNQDTNNSAGAITHWRAAAVAAADQTPVVSAAAKAAAQHTLQKARAIVAAQADAAKGHPATVTRHAAALSSSSATALCIPSRPGQGTIAAAGSQFAVSVGAFAPAPKALPAATGAHAASRHSNTAKHKKDSYASRRGTGQEQSAATGAQAAPSSPSAAASRGTQIAAEPHAAAPPTSPARHACGPSRLGPRIAQASVRCQFRSTAEHSSNTVVISSEVLAGAQQRAGTCSKRVHILVSCKGAGASVASRSGSESLLLNSSAAQQDGTSANVEDRQTSKRDLLSAVDAELQEQNYSEDAGQASFTMAVAAATTCVQNKSGSASAASDCSRGVPTPCECTVDGPSASALEADAISTSRAASFSGLRGLDSTADAGSSSEQCLAEASIANKRNSLSQLAAAACGIQLENRASSFFFSFDGNAASQGSNSGYTTKPGSREASFSKPSSTVSKIMVVGSREPSFSGPPERLGSMDRNFNGSLASRGGSITTKGTIRRSHASAADVGETAECEVDCSAASDLSLHYEGRVGAD